MKPIARFSAYAAIGLCAAAIGAVTGLHHWDATAAQVDQGAAIFQQTLPDSAGKELALSQYRGKVVVVNFWATWCGPCVEEIPEFSKIQTEFGAKNVQFVGIGIDSAANIKDFVAKISPSYPLLVAGSTGSDLVREMGNTSGALPFTLIIGANGKIISSKMGRMKGADLRALLKTASASS